MSKKIIWRVSPAPTGRYRSFQQRSWPSASFESEDGKAAAHLVAEDGREYRGIYLHQEDLGFKLKVRVAIRAEGPPGYWKWATLKARATSIKEAKELVKGFYSRYQYPDEA